MSIRVRSVRLGGEHRPPGPAANPTEDHQLPHYLLSVQQPDGPRPEPEVLAQIDRNLAELREDLRGAGAWVFAGGLHDPTTSTVLRAQGSEVLITDGPFTEGKEHLGGVQIIQAPDLDAALEWGRRLALATTLAIEVRPFLPGAES